MIYSKFFYGDKRKCLSLLGLGRNLLDICEQERKEKNYPLLVLNRTAHDGSYKIKVTSLNGEQGRIEIIAGEEGYEPEPFLFRQRVIHCRLELQPADMDYESNEEKKVGHIPKEGEYGGDPSFIMFRPLPTEPNKTIYVHFIYNIDAKIVYEFSDADLPPSTSLEDAVELVEIISGSSFLPKLKDSRTNKPFNPLTVATSEEPNLDPIDSSGYTVHPDTTDFNKMGYLDKYPDKKNLDEGEVWERDKYIFQLLIDDKQWNKSTWEGKKMFHLLRDFFARIPIVKHKWEYLEDSSYDDGASLEDLTRNPEKYFWYSNSDDEGKLTAYSTMQMFNSVETYRRLYTFYGVDESSGENLYSFEPWFPDNPELSQPKPSNNNVPILDKFEVACSIQTPFVYIVSDFRHIKALGDTTLKQDKFNKLLEVVTDENGSQTISERCFTKPNYTIIPYFVESVDMYPLVKAHGLYQGTDPWELPEHSFYRLDSTHFVFGADVIDVNDCEELGEEQDLVDYWCKQYYVYLDTEACNDWLLMPFRGDMWFPDLSDMFTWDDYHYMDKYFPTVNEWEPGGVPSIPTNRAILCVRSFFAGEELTETTISGKRKQYDVRWERDKPPEASDFWNRLPSFNNYGKWPGEYMRTDMFDPEERGSWRENTYDEVDVETSRPLDTSICPTFVTEKLDFVHIAFLSSIYAEANTELYRKSDGGQPCNEEQGCEPLCEDDCRVSERLGTIPEDETPITTKRKFPKSLENTWRYSNVYGVGVVVEDYPIVGDSLRKNYEMSGDLNYNSSIINQDFMFRLFGKDGIYIEGSDEIEPSMLERIYTVLEDNGYNRFAPINKVKLEANLFEIVLEEGNG